MKMRIGIQLNGDALSSSTAKDLNLDQATIFGSQSLVEAMHEMEISRLYAYRDVAVLVSQTITGLEEASRHAPCRTISGVNTPGDSRMAIDDHLEKDES